MQMAGSTLQIAKLPVAASAATRLFSGTVQAALVRPHPRLPGHIGVVDTHGAYYMIRLGEGNGPAAVAAVYELQLCTGGGFAQPVNKEWRAFEHLADDGLVLCQRASGRILFAQLPLCEGEHGAVFLFGSHDGSVLSLAANRELLLSGGAEGCVRLWSLDSGSMLDSRRQAGGAVQVTAVTFVGPLMVATGTDQGDVCLYDISTRRIQAVQRFCAGDGPITALACRLTPLQAHDAATAAAPRGLDGGGVVSSPAGLPWRSLATERGGTDTLLAAASTAGWMHVFRASSTGEQAWQRVHQTRLAGETFLSYSPDGNYLAVGSGTSLAVLDATTHQVIQEEHFPGGSFVGAGFLPASAGGSALVAMPLGGTLAGGIRLRLYAAPATTMPVHVQLTVPLYEAGEAGERDAEVARDEDFLSWLQHSATAPPVEATRGRDEGLPVSSPATRRGLGQLPGTVSPRNEAWGWQAFAPGASGSRSASSPQVQVRSSSGGQGRSPSVEPWASPRWASAATGTAVAGGAADPLSARSGRAPSPQQAATGSGALGRNANPDEAPFGVGGGARGPRAGEGAPAHTWQAHRPSTQPAPRSWITGLPPRADFLPQPQPTAPPNPARKSTMSALSGTMPRDGAIASTSATAAAAPGSLRGGSASHERSAGGSTSSRGARSQAAVGAAYGGAEEAGDVASEPELPHSGTLLPASGIPPSASVAAGRYSTPTMYDDGDDEDIPPVSKREWEGAQSQRHRNAADAQHSMPDRAAATASAPPYTRHPEAQSDAVEFGAAGREWFEGREYSFAQGGLGQGGSGSFGLGVLDGAVAGPASWRDGDLDMGTEGFRSSVAAVAGSSNGLAGALNAGSFRFQLPHQQQRRDGAAVEAVFAVTAHGGPGPDPGTGAALPHERLSWESGDPQSAHPEVGASDWVGEENPLERTAYFGEELASALRMGYDEAAEKTEAGDGDTEQEEVPRQYREQQHPQPRWRQTGPQLGPGTADGGAETDRKEGQVEEAEEDAEEEEDLVPRGAARLPEPQPEWAQQDRQLDAGEDEEDLPPLPSVSQSVALDFNDFGPALAAAAEPWRSQGLQQQAAAQDQGTDAEGTWSGWANADLLSDLGDGLQGAASHPAQPQAPSARPAPHPRQPPPSSSARMELSLATTAEGAPPGLEPGQGPRRTQMTSGVPSVVGSGPVYGVGTNPADGTTQRPPLAAFRGFKPNHAKVLQQLRRKAAPVRPAEAPQPATLRQQQQHQDNDEDGNAGTSANSVSVSGGQSPAQSLLQSPAVLLGSPNASISTHGSAPGTAAAMGRRQPGQDLYGGSSNRLHLHYLRQLRQQQQLRRRKQAAWPSGAQSPAQEKVAPTSSRYLSAERREGRRDGDATKGYRTGRRPPQSATPGSPWDPEAGDHDYHRQAGNDERNYPDGADGSPLKAPQLCSTALLLKKMQAVEQVATKPSTVVSRATGHGVGRGGGIDHTDSAGLNEAQREEAARRAATTAANVPPEAHLYRDLPAVDYQTQQPSRVAKQLHPGWVASRQLKPELGALWRHADHAKEVCNTRGVALYVPPSTAEVAANALRLQWLC